MTQQFRKASDEAKREASQAEKENEKTSVDEPVIDLTLTLSQEIAVLKEEVEQLKQSLQQKTKQLEEKEQEKTTRDCSFAPILEMINASPSINKVMLAQYIIKTTK
ncbi:MAG: hypothetical protein ACYCT1_20620 [Steroidobacteraceae bacterium]